MSLEIKNLSVKIKKTKLLNKINLKAKNSDLNIIIGPNGAGKSTLLKSICKIIDYVEGEILLNDENIIEKDLQEVSKNISYMGQFQNNSNLNVIDILELSRRKYSGFSLNNEDHKIIEKIIKEVDIEKFLHNNIDLLSGGEKQKVFLAASLIQEPKVLLLDEPTSFLDPKNQIEMLEIIKKVSKEKSLITLMVIHDLQNALHYADKIIMLKDKEIIDFQDSLNVDAKMISNLYNIPCEIFWQNGHPFTFFGHTHNHGNSHHNHHEH